MMGMSLDEWIYFLRVIVTIDIIAGVLSMVVLLVFGIRFIAKKICKALKEERDGK